MRKQNTLAPETEPCMLKSEIH